MGLYSLAKNSEELDWHTQTQDDTERLVWLENLDNGDWLFIVRPNSITMGKFVQNDKYNLVLVETDIIQGFPKSFLFPDFNSAIEEFRKVVWPRYMANKEISNVET